MLVHEVQKIKHLTASDCKDIFKAVYLLLLTVGLWSLRQKENSYTDPCNECASATS